MKRPVTLLLVAALLASGAAYAKTTKEKIADRVAQNVARSEHHRDRNDRPNDRRDDHRNDHRNDRGNDHRNDHRNDRRDDHRNDHRPSLRHDNDRPSHGGWDRPRADWTRHPNYWDNRRHDRRDYARYRYHFGSYHAPRGYYYRAWHRGDRLPSAWYGRQYVVYDWRPYRLYAPPYGYHWVRVGNDVVLTALATGLVLDAIYDIWY